MEKRDGTMEGQTLKDKEKAWFSVTVVIRFEGAITGQA